MKRSESNVERGKVREMGGGVVDRIHTRSLFRVNEYIISKTYLQRRWSLGKGIEKRKPRKGIKSRVEFVMEQLI